MKQLPELTGVQKAKLRSLGQTLSDSLRIGRAGPTPALLVELNRQLDTRGLVKARLDSSDRHERAAWCETVVAQAPCLCVGAVGRTALFWRPGEAGRRRLGRGGDADGRGNLRPDESHPPAP